MRRPWRLASLRGVGSGAEELAFERLQGLSGMSFYLYSNEIRELAGRAHAVVNDHQKFESSECGNGLFLVWPRDDWVAT